MTAATDNPWAILDELIGISGAPALADGGAVTVPTFRMFDPKGQWFAEGHGVDPDIPVEEDPAQLAKGTRDADTASSGLRRIGTVGGDSLAGVPLAALREASDSFFRDWMEG